jgi:hypothetical protein
MCTLSPTLKDKLSPELVTSLPRKKFRTFFGSQVVDLEEDEERTCLDEIEGGGGEKLKTMTIQGNMEEQLEPNLDQVIGNIQVEFVEYIEFVEL